MSEGQKAGNESIVYVLRFQTPALSQTHYSIWRTIVRKKVSRVVLQSTTQLQSPTMADLTAKFRAFTSMTYV